MIRQIILASCIAGILASPAAAQRSFEIPGIGTIRFGTADRPDRLEQRELGQYQTLDRQRNNNEDDRVVFDLPRSNERYTELRIRAIGKVVRITGMEVVFGNGRSQKIDIYQAIYPGDVSPEIDLAGDARGIRRVIITKRKTWQRDRGEIELLGRPDDTPGGYEELATERVRDRDREVVFSAFNTAGGSRHGYDEIRFRALRNDIAIRGVEIIFGNGATQRVRFRDTLRPGAISDPIQLDGGNRGISKVVVNKERVRDNDRGRLQLLALPGKPQTAFNVIDTERTGRPGRDVVFNDINSREAWDEIRIQAVNSAVRIDDVTIVFGNNARQRVDMRNILLNPGDVSPIIKLDGRNARLLKEVIVDISRNRGRRGSLQLLGAVTSPRGPAPRPRAGPRGDRNDWVQLGARKAAMFSRDNDAIIVGERFGRFRSIRVRVRNTDVRLYGMKVTYGNGSTEMVPVSGKLDAGQSTQPFDLQGRTRFIDRIDLRYRSQFSLKGDGVVEIWGRR